VFQVYRDAWPNPVTQVSYSVRGEQDRSIESQNVLGWVPGTTEPDSFIIIMAHYDHIGALGDEFYFPGANDNASGVALLLALAESIAAHPLKNSVLFTAFSGEEVGIIGSRYFAEHPPVDLNRAKFLLNFDMVASGESGVMAVAGEDFPDLFQDLVEVNALLGSTQLSKRRNAPNSDHYFLIQHGIPGFFLYTNRGTQPYHHVEDRSETLEWDDFLHVYNLARMFLKQQTDTH
jgi:Zn-dependent M28 family amino/carboxypeptidase